MKQSFDNKPHKKELRRVLSKLGIASRKNAELIIKSCKVRVNGRIVTNPLEPVYITDKILLENKEVKPKQIEIYALNKPRGVVTTMSEQETRSKISDLMPKHTHLFPVGRLDKASRGLLLFTNDNDFSNFIQASDSKIEKIYRVQVKSKFNEDDISKLIKGITIENTFYQAKRVEIVRQNPRTSWIEIVLVEGKNREIRKILEVLNYEILDLIRIQIGKLKLRDLEIQSGQYKQIRKDDVI